MRLMMFSKHLQDRSVEAAGKAIKALGFAGVDLTVREEGHVLPPNVKTDLPAAVRTLKDLGLEVPFITTAVTSADAPHAHAIFETAAALGIRELKLGYWWYREFGTFAAGLAAMERDLEGIEALARRCGVRANVHTHSGDCFSASAVAIWEVIRHRHPAAIGAYADPGHLMVEGGGGAWKQGLDLLGPRLGAVAVKDFEWHRVTTPADPRGRYRARLVPLERGMVPWPEVFGMLRKSGFAGWVSVHSEYQGSDSWKSLTPDELLAQTGADLVYLRRAMEG